jgi:hypothetical protein
VVYIQEVRYSFLNAAFWCHSGSHIPESDILSVLPRGVILALFLGVWVSELSLPDEKERTKKAVDVNFSGEGSRYVMEYAQVESFPKQITDGVRKNLK